MQNNKPVAWRFQTHAGGRWYLTHFEENARAFQNNGEGGDVQALYADEFDCNVCHGSGLLAGLSKNITKCSYCGNGWREIAKTEAELRLVEQKQRDGQKLLVQQILDTDRGLSEDSRKILEELIK